MIKNLEEYNNKYIGKPALIIASGPSVLEQDVSMFSEFVTISVNSGYLLYESDFFVSDDWSVMRWSYFVHDLKNSNKTIALLYEDKLKNSCKLFGDRSVLFKHRTGYNITNTYSHSNKSNHIVQARTSVGTAIHIAHIMGCSKIALIGVDGCRPEGCRHFWQSSKFTKKTPQRSDRIPKDHYLQCNYKGSKSDHDLKDILLYWNRYGREFLKKCQVYNASKDSVISVFPKKNLEELL